jgi:S-formylglutathione hydrolase FrmB
LNGDQVSLLGTPLLVVLALLTVATPAAILLVWPRVRGPRAVQVGSRVGLVVVAQATALLFGGVALNDYGQFFTSWSDLLGTSAPAHVVGFHHYGADASARRVLHGRTGNWATGNWATKAGAVGTTQGKIVTMQVAGPTTGLAESASVYLPPAYFAGDRKMPMVIVLSGYPGSTMALIDRLHYPTDMLAAINSGAPPMVLVMMRPSVVYPRDTECTDVPNGPQAFSYFAHDVPDVVSGALGLHPSSYGAIGDSTGALCAAKLAVMDPQRFTAAVSLSGYFHAIGGLGTGNLYGGSKSVRNSNDIIWRLKHLPLPHVSLLVATSLTEHGADGYGSAQQLLSLVHSPMSADEIVLNRGGHNFETWNREIPTALRWLAGKLG